jgi:hypothetical protein
VQLLHHFLGKLPWAGSHARLALSTGSPWGALCSPNPVSAFRTGCPWGALCSPNPVSAKQALHTLQRWIPYVVDATVVRVESLDTATVEVPVLRPPAASAVADQEDHLNDFISALAFLVSQRCQTWADPGCQLRFVTRPHNAWHAEADGDEFWYKACHTERPAFCIIDADGKELLHLYFAMGLDLQHPAAATPLALVRRSRLLLAALLAELPRLLPVQPRREHITFQVPGEQKTTGSPTEVEEAVMGTLSELGLLRQVQDGDLEAEDHVCCDAHCAAFCTPSLPFPAVG